MEALTHGGAMAQLLHRTPGPTGESLPVRRAGEDVPAGHEQGLPDLDVHAVAVLAHTADAVFVHPEQAVLSGPDPEPRA